ncbi:MAG: MMPL family transporter [Eubacterium sp.]|nr:MMPL family transporter [Eubacterium sp.]
MMDKFGHGVVKYRVIILIIAVVLLIPAAIGYFKTGVNYDLLFYLPKNIDTMKGQDILMDDFGSGAFGLIMTDGLNDNKTTELKKKIEKVDAVQKVLWYDSVADLRIPKSMLPKRIYKAFNKDGSTVMMVIFNDTSSAERTMKAVTQIRKITKNQCKVTGITAIVEDTKELSEHETPIYVGIAIVISIILLSLLMDSWVIPFVFIASIGTAIIYNLGSNVFFGQISYVTKALAAVLQLAVTMDYSIFLWHSYEENLAKTPEDRHGAMGRAIKETLSSIVGSSVTTVAGFIALCFMSFTLGLDLGVVMAKGVIIGVIACVTILPSLILVFDKAIEKTKHRQIMPDFKRLPKFITKYFYVFVIIFIILLIPGIYGYNHNEVYYDLSISLPEDLESVKTQKILNEDFKIGSANIVVLDKKADDRQVKNMIEDLNKLKGVKRALGLESLVDSSIPEAFIPDRLTNELKSDEHQMVIFLSEYKTGSDEANRLADQADKVIKKYDKAGMQVGEAPCTRDLIKITDKDFKVVSFVSIFLVFLIILCVFRSVSIPVFLVALIESAIFINMGTAYFTNTTLPFVASIVIGTIQLGATVDYAILMTNRYKVERNLGKDKKVAARDALAFSMKSVIVSALTFFGATFGVGIYSSIDMIGSLCMLMARGAIISMLCVICVLPALFIIFDKLIVKGSYKFIGEKK